MSILIKAAGVKFWIKIINSEDVVKEKSQLFFLRLDGWRKKSRNHWSYYFRNSGLIILGSVEDSVLWVLTLLQLCVHQWAASFCADTLAFLAGHFLCKDHLPVFSMPSLETETTAERQQNLKWSKVSPSAEVLGRFLNWCCRRHCAASTRNVFCSAGPRFCSLLFLPASSFHILTSLYAQRIHTPACACAHFCPSVCVFVWRGKYFPICLQVSLYHNSPGY